MSKNNEGSLRNQILSNSYNPEEMQEDLFHPPLLKTGSLDILGILHKNPAPLYFVLPGKITDMIDRN